MKKQPEQSQSPCPPFSLLVEHVAHAEKLTRQQREFVVDHIRQCGHCCEIYGALSDLDEEFGEDIRQGAGIPKPDIRPICTAEEAFARDWQRIQAYEAAERAKRRKTLVFRIGRIAAAAACIVIAIGVGWVMMHKGNSGHSDSDVAANNAGSPAAFAELVTAEGRKPLDLNQPITAGDQPQEILLGGMHRVVMNSHTKATFTLEPRRTEGPYAGKIPYEIQLAQGELYVEVEPGNPFTVKTADARLDITGTKFDVATDGDKTELTLLKGSVRFSQLSVGNAADIPNSYVDVTAGHASTINARSAPTLPRQANALALTAWARDLALANTIASVHPDDDLLLGSIHNYWPQSNPLDLNSIDYVKWRDEHRDWFAREFPWVFKAQKALKDQYGINADYIELLMVSGDIWQFNYPRLFSQPIPVFNAASVQQIAKQYGVDPAALLDAVGVNVSGTTTNLNPADRPIADMPTTYLAQAANQYQSALQRWQLDLVGISKPVEGSSSAGSSTTVDSSASAQSDLLMFTLRAGTYLSNTRTTAWVWTRMHQEQAAALFTTWRQSGIAFLDSEGSWTYQQWLDRLQNDATAADSISRLVPELLIAPKAIGCDTQGNALRTQLAKTAAAILASEGMRQ